MRGLIKHSENESMGCESDSKFFYSDMIENLVYVVLNREFFIFGQVMMFPTLIVSPSLCSGSQSKLPRRMALPCVLSVNLLYKYVMHKTFCHHFVNEMGVVSKLFQRAIARIGKEPPF